MDRRTVQLLIAVMFLASLSLVGSQSSQAQSAENQVGAAALVLSQSGKIGGYGLSEPPGYPGARCRYDASGFGGDGAVTLSYITFPTATAHTDYSSQLVSVSARAYQKLANGSLQFLYETITAYTVVNSTPTIVYPNSFTLPAGPTYVLAYEFIWYNPSTPDVVEGRVTVAYTSYRPSILDPAQVFPNTSVCASVWPPFANVSNTSGTVNSTLNYSVHRYPLNVTVQVRWDGTSIDTVHTNNTAKGSDSLKIPASPKGPHTLSFSYGTWSSSVSYTIKPRIKFIPDTVARGSTVDVSLRGFAAHESVRIRWKKGSSWVQVGQVTTSSTGSANVDVTVPTWALNGPASVRGDGATSAAQTNAVTVNGGPTSSSAVKTPVPTATPSSTATIAPTQTSTVEATIPVETPSPKPTEPPAASPVAATN
jgi:hypothetical protein